MAGLTAKDLQKLTRLFQDETGILDFTTTQVAEWLKRKGVEMPVPPTAVEMMAKRVSKALGADRRSAASGLDYRGTLSYKRRVDGQMEFYWFDADGPAATAEKMRKSAQLRFEHVLNSSVQIAATNRRWNATHPDEDPLQIDFDLNDEVTWRLNGMVLDDDIEKAG